MSIIFANVGSGNKKIGSIIQTFSASGLSVGDIVRYDSAIDKNVVKCSDNAHINLALGIVIYANPTSCNVMMLGFVTTVFAGFTRGEMAYLGTDGNPANTPPATGYVQIIGYCHADTLLFVNFMHDRIKRLP